MKELIFGIMAAGLLMTGCCSKSSSKPTLERGWIGGEFHTAGRKLVPDGQKSAVYVKQTFPGTPAEKAGLQTGDLIVGLNSESVRDLKDFHRLVDTAAPGSRATIQVLRDGKSLDLPLTVGREKYQEWHAIVVGFYLSSKLDLWPDPSFSLAPVARFHREQDRIELAAPEVVLGCHKKDSGEEAGTPSSEGWDAWFVIFGMNAYKRILAQEPISPTSEASPLIRAAR
jgi:hypothetical protein